MADILLTHARIGMGNPMHQHVHRHNQMALSSQSIDSMIFAANNGGVHGAVINKVAAESGGLTVQPRGFVNIEDTYNQRRGIMAIRFSVMKNALQEEELTMLFYLTGGEPRENGVDEDTMAVPVRAYTINRENTPSLDGTYGVKNSVTNSIQMLMGDPTMQRKLRGVRPEDVGNEVLGYMSSQQEGAQDGYVGTLNGNLDKSMLISRTSNLDPSHHTKQLLKIATTVLHDRDYQIKGTDSVANAIGGAGMLESTPSDNYFFKAMSQSMGTWSWNGFQGYTLKEIQSVFDNFAGVLDITTMDPNLFPMVDEIAMSSAYGATSDVESGAQEVAMLTADCLIKAGLSAVTFTATNNVSLFNNPDLEDGAAIWNGEFMSLMDEDNDGIARVERFKEDFKNRYFAKYNTGYLHSSTIVSINVKSFLFGETSVEICYNGDESNMERYVNATYLLPRTSSNIAGSDAGVNDAINYLKNITDFFQ